MKNIGVIGAGHVGLVTAACFAHLGNRVIAVDQDSSKIKKLENGVVPFFEPGLKELVKEGIEKNLLFFSESIEEATKKSEIIFIAVGTPTKESGEPDLSAVEKVTSEIAKSVSSTEGPKDPFAGYRLIVEKSTVPARTGKWLKKLLTNPDERSRNPNLQIDVCANPEFLREGSAISDFLNPDRVVIGCETERAKKMMEELYAPLKAPLIFTDVRSAELIKHASNSFLALKVSYINAIANICERVGADVEKVAKGMGLDRRIGKEFLKAGIGYGGSCFPKDVAAFINLSEEIGYNFELLKVVEKINEEQKNLVIKKAKELLWNLKGKRIGVLGLSFKPKTDDIRESPAIEIIQKLLREGAMVKAFDPVAAEEAKKILPEITYCNLQSEVAENSDLLMILTEWSEFRELDWKRIKSRLRKPFLIDGRNILEPEKMRELGFTYCSIGRK